MAYILLRDSHLRDVIVVGVCELVLIRFQAFYSNLSKCNVRWSILSVWTVLMARPASNTFLAIVIGQSTNTIVLYAYTPISSLQLSV